jgi:hypothetical protein
MKNYLKSFINDIDNVEYVYLLSSDGYRDSISLENCALSEQGLVKILILEQLEFGNKVIPESVKVDSNNLTINFQYKDIDDDIESGKYQFFKVKIVN